MDKELDHLFHENRLRVDQPGKGLHGDPIVAFQSLKGPTGMMGRDSLSGSAMTEQWVMVLN